jgi:hypothetical protein
MQVKKKIDSQKTTQKHFILGLQLLTLKPVTDVTRVIGVGRCGLLYCDQKCACYTRS